MIKVFRQALSLDERRVMFRPNLYHHPAPAQFPSPTKQTRSLPRRVLHTLNPFKVEPLKQVPDTPHHHYSSTASRAGPGVEPEPPFEKIKQVWFAGCHSDVGGGNAKDSSTLALSNIPLRWMVREVMNTTPDVHFDTVALKELKIPLPEIRPLGARVQEASEATVVEDPRPALQHVNSECDSAFRKESTSTHTHAPTCGGECSPLLQSLALDEALDARDLVNKSTDEIKRCPCWWILEIWPTYRQWQDKDGQWVGQRSWHRARGRELPPKPVFHESVRTLMKDKRYGYAPTAPLHNDQTYEE